MADVYVRISTGTRYYVDERIQKAFPDDFVIVDEPKKKSATAANDNGGKTEGDHE